MYLIFIYIFQLELVGVSILDYTHPGDKSKLMRNLERRPPTQPPPKGGKLAAIGHDARAPSPGGSSSTNGGGQHLVPVAGPSSSGGQPAHSGGQSNGQADDLVSFLLSGNERTLICLLH
jgi:hypothetical protein